MRKDRYYFDGVRTITDIPRESFTLPCTEEIANTLAELNQAPAAQHDELVDREAMGDQ